MISDDQEYIEEQLPEAEDIYNIDESNKEQGNVFLNAIDDFEARRNEEPEYLKRIKSYLAKPQITDIHVTEERPLVIRMAGAIYKTSVVVPKNGITEITDKIFHLPNYSRPNSAGEYGGYRVRLRSSQALQHKQLFIRVLPGRAPDIDKMGYGVFLREKILDAPLAPGIVIVAGATGSGKSTMLAGLLQTYLDNNKVHIVTAEDPVEYILYDGEGEISQRELPDDVDNFHDAIINALREDPDIILIGETRDSATAIALLQASETGHLAFTTIHAPDIPGIIGRLKGLLVDTVDVDMRLAQVIKGCIYLTLVRDPETESFSRRAEVLWFDDKTKELIRDNKNYHMLKNYVKVYNVQNNSNIKGKQNKT